MSKITFQYRGLKDTGKLSLRLIHGTDIDYRVSTPIASRKEYWIKNKKKRTLKDLLVSDPVQKNHGKTLLVIRERVLKKFESDYNSGIAITREWLKNTIVEIANILDDKEKISQVAYENRLKACIIFFYYIKFIINISKLSKESLKRNLLFVFK